MMLNCSITSTPTIYVSKHNHQIPIPTIALKFDRIASYGSEQPVFRKSAPPSPGRYSHAAPHHIPTNITVAILYRNIQQIGTRYVI